jgi:hypothetical protein
MMEEICSSEMSVLTRATWRNIPENGILHDMICLEWKWSSDRVFRCNITIKATSKNTFSAQDENVEYDENGMWTRISLLDQSFAVTRIYNISHYFTIH